MNDFDVLVVEDEPVVIEATRKALHPEGLRIDAAEDGESALAKLRQSKYKLILLDLMLPRITGFELVKAVTEQSPGVPVILITGYATFDKTVAAFQAGAFDFLPKPFDVEELLGVVRRALRFFGQQRSVDQQQQSAGGSRENLFFLGAHSWTRLEEDGSATVGLGETFAGVSGDLQAIELPTPGEEMAQGKSFAKLMSSEGLVGNVWSPLSGRVQETNSDLHSQLHWIDKDPFEKGWLVKLSPTHLEQELKNLTQR